MAVFFQTLPLYLLLGAIAGTLAGLLGIGGGLIIVPALMVIFSAQNIPQDQLMHLALATSLASIVLTSLSSIYAHQQHHAINWKTFKQLSPSILLGSYIGAWLATYMHSHTLQSIFAAFEITVGIYMLLGFKTPHHKIKLKHSNDVIAGNVIGSISAIVGIGGGTLSVPYLLWRGENIHKAIATSAACGLPIALAGSLSYVVNGYSTAIPNTLAFIHLPALFGIILSSMLFAPLGARLAHSLPVIQLKKIFALFLLLIGCRLFFNGF